ncbi:MAG TPA: hypothetical protein VFZ24_12695 [Longimicrobiales bacterium]
MFPFLLMSVAGGVVVAVIVGVRRREQRRTAAVRDSAARLGWGFHEEVAFDAIPDLDRFELFRQGRRRRLSNLLTSPAGAARGVVFDYAYTTGGGNSQSRHHQTVFYGVGDGLGLPTFSVRPQHFGHSIAKAFGYQDIDLAERPRFSDGFVLRGEDERAVRDLFGRAAVVDFFEARAGVCAAGAGREVLFWRPGRRARADEVESLIADGFELVRRLTG